MNYFFGQNGPGPLTGATVERAGAGGIVSTTGRDVAGADPALDAGLMAGKRAMERGTAAFDMKSLGRHIEAVSVCLVLGRPLSFCYHSHVSIRTHRRPTGARS